MSSQEGIHYLSNPLNHFTPLSFYVIIIKVKLIVNVYACMLSCFTRVQLFVTLWTCSLPGSSVRGILQAKILEWVVISFSRRSSQPRD